MRLFGNYRAQAYVEFSGLIPPPDVGRFLRGPFLQSRLLYSAQVEEFQIMRVLFAAVDARLQFAAGELITLVTELYSSGVSTLFRGAFSGHHQAAAHPAAFALYGGRIRLFILGQKFLHLFGDIVFEHLAVETIDPAGGCKFLIIHMILPGILIFILLEEYLPGRLQK